MKSVHVFITGGTRGIGNGLVKEFLKRGHKVSFTGTTQVGIDKALEDLSGEFNGIICDVRNYDEIENAKSIAFNKFTDIDIWINNAGVTQPQKDVYELTEEEIKRVIDINVTGMIMATAIAVKQMKKQKYGIVYNMEGLGSNNMMIPKTIVYGSSKRLLRYYSRAICKELKNDSNIFVGTISPGMVFTDLLLKDATEESMRITNILGNKVEEVTPFLVKNMLRGKKHIYWLTNRKVMWRFFTSIFKKKYTR